MRVALNHPFIVLGLSNFFKPAILVTVSPMETPDISRDMTHFSDSQAAKMCHRSQFLDFWLQSIRNTRTIGVIS